MTFPSAGSPTPLPEDPELLDGNVNVPNLEEEEVYVFPMSFGQQRLWFLDQFEPGSPYYNIPSAIRLTGRLDSDALARSLDEIARRHEVLRTTFTTMNGQPVQVIHPTLKLPLPVIDLRHLPAAEREAEATRLATIEVRTPFDLTAGPVIRAKLIRLQDEEHLALLTVHHIASDGWSMGVLVKELALLYNAYNSNLPSPLPELAIQYADYAEWQREWLQGEVLEQQLTYWTKQLGGEQPVLELPTDRARPAVRTDRGSSFSALLPRTLLDALYELGRQEGATLFMVLMAAFQALLYRYSDQEKISVGTPIANRTRGETEDLIGLFINTLVIRTDLSDEPTFRELLARVKEVALGAYAHQDLPFEMLVDALQPERDMSHSPLFQVMFILQNLQQASMRTLALPDLSLRMLDIDMGTSTFDLTFSCSEQPDGLSVAVEYNTDLFDRSTVERMLRQYRTLLQGALAKPHQSITTLPVLTAAEEEQVLRAWNDIPALYDPERCLHELFADQATRTPDAEAVVFVEPDYREGDIKTDLLTYEELDRRANQLAHHLQHLGVGPEVLVGISVERSLELIVGVLGVLKAGGAYVPIDPSYPHERIAFMIEDSGIQVLLTSGSANERMGEWANGRISGSAEERRGEGPNRRGPEDPFAHSPIRTVLLDADWPTVAQQPEQAPETSIDPDHVAYVIYTSGSTGQSKGVPVSHRNIANAYLAWEQAYRLREQATSHLQMASFSFDVFTGDLARALGSGGKLVLCPREWLLAPNQLYALMRHEQVDCAEFVPAVLRHLVEYLEDQGQDLAFMRLLICGSDSWYAGEYRRFQELCGPQTRLINSFGLTEATIDSCFFEGPVEGLPADRLVPIGRPLGQQQLYVLDRHLRPMPIGVIGELYVGGLGVARGYLNRPALTAERFIPDPFLNAEVGSQRSEGRKQDGSTTDEFRSIRSHNPLHRSHNPLHRSHNPLHRSHNPLRLYRTGDMARWLPNGNVEFLGRLDHQVKIRGFRIEPGEVEAVLGQHPQIRQAVVMARQAPAGDQRLAAYYVTHPTEPASGAKRQDSLSSGDLRRYLQERLADYMVPSAFVQLDTLPLTPNGKVDRLALPEPDWSRRELAGEYVAPRTPVEEILAGVWAKVLGMERVGIHDNFFELGGHSLLATQLISRVRKAFGIDLPLRHIFESPTVAALAPQVELAQQQEASQRPPPIRPVSRDQALPLSFAQQRLWFLDQLEPNSPLYNIPESLRLHGPLDTAVLARALDEVVRRHESLRTSFHAVDGKPIQVITPAISLPLSLEDLSHLPVEERESAVRQLAEEEAQRPFDLGKPPLMRARLLRLAEDDHVVLVTTHHIISDNWSSGVLTREMAIIYDAYAHGRPSPLPELLIQYADFACWQRNWLQGEVLEGQIEYWKQQLAGAPPLLELPTDRPRPPVQTFRGAYQSFQLPEELSNAIRALGQKEGATLFMTLLAAFKALLARYSGQRDISVGTPIANRTRADIEGIIGFFVNTLVVRTRLDEVAENPSFRQLLGQLRETALAAYAHQDLPFEMIVEAVQPERRLSTSPLFQVMFALQSAQSQERTQVLSELTISPVEAHSGTSKFDLTLFMVDTPRLSGALEYNTDLFDAATIQRMLGHFQRLLEGVVASPDSPVAELPLLEDSERDLLLVSWNETAAEYPDQATIHQRIQAQALERPEAVAVVYQDDRLTFRELDKQANQLAHFLRRRGVGPDTLVGLAVPRSTALIVGLLGILKAGGAYLPIDPTYPKDRVAFMIEDSGIQVLLTSEFANGRISESADQRISDQGLAGAARREWANRRSPIRPFAHSPIRPFADTPIRTFADSPIHTLLIDTDWPLIAQEPEIAPVDLTLPDHLAYVIYTSGSTGRPKGVMISHRSAMNLGASLQRTMYNPRGGGPLRISLNAPLSFDASVQQLVMLSYGHTLVVIPEEIRRDASGLLDYIRSQGIDLLDCVPSQLKLLLEAGLLDDAGWVPSVVLPGGEAIDPKTWRMLASAPATEFFNVYGPTECTVDSSTANVRNLSMRPTIGQPLDNVTLYVLDSCQQPVPIGVPGELYIGGVGVARGYLQRPSLTAERFVPNPFLNAERGMQNAEASMQDGPTSEEIRSHNPLRRSHNPLHRSQNSLRLYRTGDLVRWLPDGNIDFLGRIDHQVKVRGYRIELGEIEAVLRRHPDVADVVAVARRDGAADPREGDPPSSATHLVAYLVPVEGKTVPSAGELRGFSSETLPTYMIPSAFVVLEALPLTPNRKVDRRALPAPDFTRPDVESIFVAPRSPEEELVADVWAHILNLPQVGVHDNFFELGGHSLLATQVVSRLSDAFDIEVPLRLLFEAPTVARLAEALGSLYRSRSGMQVPPISPISRDEALPLSFAQQRLWFLDQLEPNSPLYNIPAAARLSGPLDVAALQQSLNAILRRHEALRTTFVEVDGRPTQVIDPQASLELPLVDLTSLPEPDRLPEATRQVAQLAELPFNLATGPLLRAGLWRLAPEDHVVLLSMHHIVSDDWSLGVLLHELAVLYSSAVSGAPSPLLALTVQYADFAAWQRRWLQGDALEAQLSYWQQQLSGLPPLLPLPTDRPRPASQTYRGAQVNFRLDQEITVALKELGRQEGATLFMTLLAAFQTLLYRYTGQDDIAVGTPIANRNRAQVENLIGFFVNTLVMRGDLSDGPSFRELLRRTRETALGAYAHQDVPFEMLVDALQPQRDMSHSPLFQAMLVLQNAPRQAQQLAPNLALTPLVTDDPVARFDLTLSMMEDAQGVGGSFEYNTDLFDRNSIERLVEHFLVLLTSLVASPDRSVTYAPLLTAPEREALARWNDTATAPVDRLVHQIVEGQVQRRPDAPALVWVRRDEELQELEPTSDGNDAAALTLTYAELDRRANQLAHYLRQLGVGPESLVGILVERSPEMVIGLLGILKAGGAYLPIDPAYPADRIAFMIRDSGTTLLLTSETANQRISESADQRIDESANQPVSDRSLTPSPIRPFAHSPIRTLLLDTDWPTIAQQPETSPELAADGDNLAYVIYTSGSTGRPKGTMLQHRGLTNLVQAQTQGFDVDQNCRILQFASFSFDASVSETFVALCNGATLVLAEQDMLAAGPELLALLRDQQITTVILPPSLLAVLEPDGLESLHTVISAGEACTWEIVDRWAPGRRFVNAYGPTEATVGPTYCLVDQLAARPQTVPVGRPIDNFLAYVLDANLEPVPAGVVGELFLGGFGLARGYLNRPSLTAERFIPNPFLNAERGTQNVEASMQDGSTPDEIRSIRSQNPLRRSQNPLRLYRTGDLARYSPDGTLEILGRVDFQVKLRGFRIELGEIEAVLRQHPAVQEAVALVRQDRLLAYLVPANATPAQPAELRDYLRRRLPDYMVPSAFVSLNQLPLSPSGKVDRRALRDTEPDQMPRERAYVAPRTPEEEILAGLWADLLQVDQVGIHDGFFELGGHSLLATQLLSRIRQAFQVELPLRAIFQQPTVAGLATAIQQARLTAQGIAAPPMVQVDRSQPLPLSFAQQRLWFLDQLQPNSPFYNLPAAVRLAGPLDVDAFERTINEIIRRHESLRTTFATNDQGQAIQVIAPALELELPVVDLRSFQGTEQEERVGALAAGEAQRPFDLARGPLWRVTLLRLATDEHVVLFTMHHIVSDGWSMGVLMREIGILYEAFSNHQSVSLPPLAAQYADFAHWQRTWLQGDVLEQQLAFWRDQLAGLPPLLALPTDRPRPAAQTYAGASIDFSLSPELSRAIKSLGQQEGSTLFMTLLAAFQSLLYRCSGQHDIAIGTPIANRNRAEIEGLIGFFVNTLVMRGDLSGGLSFRALLRQVRETALNAYAHQDIPFEMLVDDLQPQRDMSHSPLFQAVLTLQNTPIQARELPSGLAMDPISADAGIAKFDLTLSMMESPAGLQGSFEYNTDLFDADRIQRMIGHFRTLLQAIVDDPEQAVTDLPLLTEDERDQILVQWNDHAAGYPLEQCVHHLFEAQAAATSNGTAVVFTDGATRVELTYDQLNRRANRLAHHLQQLGVGPDVLVGISVQRSADFVIGLLGVLKAGGAYLPIDPTYPADRIAFMIEDSGIGVLLTSEWANGRISESAIRTLLLDSDWPAIARQPDHNPEPTATLDNLAYAIYTSGSTGVPKGTLLQHRGLTNLVLAQTTGFGVQEDDRVLLFASFSFDASVSETFMALTTGATLYLAPQEILASPDQLLALMRREAITTITWPPTLLKALAADPFTGPEQGLPDLRILISAGEACPPDVARYWASGRRFFNAYGPTEATVGPTYYQATGELLQDSVTVPIGRPIPNTQVYILDANDQPVPVGIPGQLHLGGVGLARGYLNRPALTAERFVPNSFLSAKRGTQNAEASVQDGPTPDEIRSIRSHNPLRLYRTGDLVRWLPDGSLQFLGRIDHQVKLRGFRIELGEIEAVLRQHPGIQEAVALAPEGERLIAYVVGVEGQTPTPSQLRAFLRERLPDYMLPGAIITLDVIPLTPSGKVDRKQLPDAAKARESVEKGYVAPRTPQERALAQIWQRVLRLDRVGIRDDFFQLGGDSILSIQVVALARQAGLHISPRQFFQEATIAALAVSAGESQATDSEQGIVTGPVPLTPIQQWFFDQHTAGPHHWNTSLLLALPIRVDRALLEQTIRHMMIHHDALRLRFVRTDSGWQQSIAAMSEQPVPLTWLDLSHLEGDNLRHAIEQHAAEAQGSLDLTSGPLLRVVYMDLGRGRSPRLLLVLHHLVMDGVSLRIFLQDFLQVYVWLQQGEPAKLPAKTTSFKTWATSLAAYAQSEELLQELPYWRAVATHPVDPLPVDWVGGANTYGSTGNVTMTLDRERTRTLLQDVPNACGARVEELLLTALGLSLAGWTGKRVFRIEMEGHGREAVLGNLDVSRTIGWFTSRFPVLLELQEPLDPASALASVGGLLRSIPNRGFGFELLRHLCQDPVATESLRSMPDPPVNFNYLGQFDQAGDTSLPIGLAPESAGPEQHPEDRRNALLYLVCSVSGEQLGVRWLYSSELHRRSTIERLANDFMAHVDSLVEACLSRHG